MTKHECELLAQFLVNRALSDAMGRMTWEDLPYLDLWDADRVIERFEARLLSKMSASAQLLSRGDALFQLATEGVVR